MPALATQERNYALGHSEQEFERLARQGDAFAPFTRQLFVEAGIRPGMRLLDVGCGAGDVSLLAARLVGPAGEVVSFDREPAAVEWARARAHAEGVTNVRFVIGDPTEARFDTPFDGVIGRLILMYYPDPVEALRKLAEHVRAGGLIVFQELDCANCRSLPRASIFEKCIQWITRALLATGARVEQGLELFPAFLAAGLPEPCLRMDALIGGGEDCAAYGLMASVVRTLLPMIEKLKIATAADVDIGTLEQRMRDEVVRNRGVVLSPGLVGAWSRKPITSNIHADLISVQ